MSDIRAMRFSEYTGDVRPSVKVLAFAGLLAIAYVAGEVTGRAIVRALELVDNAAGTD